MNKLIVATIPLAWVRADCLGLYPTVFGIEGDWVNSDIQFALQVRNDIVNFMKHLFCDYSQTDKK